LSATPPPEPGVAGDRRNGTLRRISFSSLPSAVKQGLTLFHFSAEPEPFLTRNTPCTPNNTAQHPIDNPKQPLYAPPIPQEVNTLS